MMVGIFYGYSPSDSKGNMSKELISTLNEYKRTGVLWNHHGRFYSWFKSIDNEFMRQKIDWVEKDIKSGFSNFYYREAHFQKYIDKPWINDICLNRISNDPMLNYCNTDIAIDVKDTISREDYQCIYDPVDIGLYSSAMREEHNLIFYDMRVDNLAKDIESGEGNLFEEWEAFKCELENQILPLWEDEVVWYKHISKDMDVLGGHNMPKILETLNGGSYSKHDMNQPWFAINYLSHSPTEYIKLGMTYLKGFSYQAKLSDKVFKVFTKPIDESYQWAVMLFSAGGAIQLWEKCSILLVVIRISQDKPVKPKDVIYQEHYLFLHGYLQFNYDAMKHPFALQVQRFYYVGYYINRYIDYMQDKVMAVIYDA